MGPVPLVRLPCIAPCSAAANAQLHAYKHGACTRACVQKEGALSTLVLGKEEELEIPSVRTEQLWTDLPDGHRDPLGLRGARLERSARWQADAPNVFTMTAEELATMDGEEARTYKCTCSQ